MQTIYHTTNILCACVYHCTYYLGRPGFPSYPQVVNKALGWVTGTFISLFHFIFAQYIKYRTPFNIYFNTYFPSHKNCIFNRCHFIRNN